MSAESDQSMPDLIGVAAGSTNLESQLIRSAASTPSEDVPNAKRRTSPSENVPNAKHRKGKMWYWRIRTMRHAIGPAASATAEGPTTTTLAEIEAAEAPATQRSMDEHRRLLREAGHNHWYGWSKEKCKEIIQAAEALSELTPIENETYTTALDEHDWPAWFRELTGLDPSL